MVGVNVNENWCLRNRPSIEQHIPALYVVNTLMTVQDTNVVYFSRDELISIHYLPRFARKAKVAKVRQIGYSVDKDPITSM